MPQGLADNEGKCTNPFAGKSRGEKKSIRRAEGWRLGNVAQLVSACLWRRPRGSQHCTKHKPGTEAQHTGPALGRLKQEDPEFKVISYRHSHSQASLGMRPRLKKKAKGYQVQNIFKL